MNNQQLILYIGMAVLIAASIGLFVFLFYRNSFIKQNKLKTEAPIMKGRSSINIPRLGWVEVVGHDMLGNNSAMLHVADTYGNKYQEGPVYAEELIPVNVFQNMNGPGNQAWRYIPRKERQIESVVRQAQYDREIKQDVTLQMEKEELAGKLRDAKANERAIVNETVESVGKIVAKSQKPEKSR